MIARFSKWIRKKSSHKVIWNGNLWDRKWDWSSIIPTLGTLAIFSGLLWGWTESIYGLSRTYEISIPYDFIGIVSKEIGGLVGLLFVLTTLFVINKFRWQKTTGISFTIVLILEIILSLIAIYLSWLSLREIYHIVIS
jgi:hypothetical protein